jgi:hypothetical protein
MNLLLSVIKCFEGTLGIMVAVSTKSKPVMKAGGRVITICIFFTLSAYGQSKTETYRNDTSAYYGPLAKNNPFFFQPKVNEIILNPDTTFEFWSRPDVSCFTWHQIKGSWKKQKDSIFFREQYDVVERDVKATYRKTNARVYYLSFSTDKNSPLHTKSIKVQYLYDFDAKLEDVDRIFQLDSNNTIQIPFTDIPNLDKLASIRIEYRLKDGDTRFCCLTENVTVNVRKSELPNIIAVEFVENPKRETLYRVFKGLIKDNTLEILSSINSKANLPDYTNETLFERQYTLVK